MSVWRGRGGWKAAAAGGLWCVGSGVVLAQHPDLVPLDLQAPTEVLHRDTIDISYVIANQGTAPAEGYWEDEVRLSVGTAWGDQWTRLARIRHDGPLAVGDSYTGVVENATITAFAGLRPYYLQLGADGRGYLIGVEPNRDNNLRLQPLAIRGVDLVLTHLESPTTLGFDRTFEVAWTARNVGTADAEPEWRDTLYLCPDEYWWMSSAVPLGEWVHSNAVPASATYTERADVSVPAGSVVPGEYNLIQVCNRYGELREVSRDGNVLVRPVVVTDSEPFALAGFSTLCLGTLPSYLQFDPPPDTDRVEFTYNGEVVGTAYGPDFGAVWNPFPLHAATAPGMGPTRIGATAYGINGDTLGVCYSERIQDLLSGMPSMVEIKEPRPGHILYTDTDPSTGDVLRIRVDAKRLDCLYQGQGTSTFHVPGTTHPQDLADVDEAWVPAAPVDIYVDGNWVHTSAEAPSEPFPYHEFEYITQDLGIGEHTLAVVVDPPGEYQSASAAQTFWVEFAQPEFGIDREVAVHTNWFEVDVTVNNRGEGSATLHRLVEPMTGFQPCSLSVSMPFTNCASVFSASGKKNLLTIEFGGEVLAPDTSFTISYQAVPILFSSDCDYVFGGEDGVISYDDPYGAAASKEWRYESTVIGYGAGRRDLGDAVEEALASSDYLLVTDPVNLAAAYGAAAGNGILADMAELATVRGGVLGYFHGLGMIRTAFSPGVLAAIGRVYEPDQAQEQLILARPAQDSIHCYFENYEKLEADANGDGTVDALLIHDLRDGDALAVGNHRIGYSTGTNYHAHAEIVVAWGSGHAGPGEEGQLHIHQYGYDTDPALGGQFTVHETGSSFVSGDRLLIGDVFIDATVPSRDDIIIAHATGTIEVREMSGRDRWTTFETDLGPTDLFAAGNLLGDDGLEMVVGRTDADEVVVYVPGEYERTWTGHRYVDLLQYDPEHTFSHLLDPADDLAVGDVTGDGYDEIIVADASDDGAILIGYDPGAGRFEFIDRFDLDYGESDDLLVGRLASTEKAQILVLRGSEYWGRPAGTVEIITYAGGEAPGDRWALDALINQGGAWAAQLCPDWATSGHLLIVGENEILPTFTKCWDISGWDNDDVGYTDRNYASTEVASDYDVPELAVGRIPGNSADCIRQALHNAISVALIPSQLRNQAGYCVSGTDDDHEDRFIPLRQSIAGTLADRGLTVLQHHTPDAATFGASAAHRDVIFFSGHGNRRTTCGITAGDIESLFNPGTRHPLVYAASCLTGRYPAGASIAETFLLYGAAAYVGATEVTCSYGTHGRGWSPRMAEAFFHRLAADRTLGQSMMLAKQYRLSEEANTYSWDWDKNRYTCATYHLYGDPKLTIQWTAGAASAASGEPPGRFPAPSANPPVQGPVSTLELAVPGFVVITNQGLHHVEIPGGGMVTVLGWPAVPFYSAAVEFPKGHVVQDVSLTARSAPVVISGLNLAPVEPWTNAPGRGPTPAENGSGWWPDEDFMWAVTQRDDGSSRLTIKAFPFYYHTVTQEAHFHTNYTFSIDDAETSLEILSLVPDRMVYAPGAVVKAALYLQHTNPAPLTVTVNAAVLAEDGTTVEALPARTLADLHSLGWCRLDWDSGSALVGEYTLDVVVTDGADTLLDQAECVFQIGGANGLIRDLSINPDNFSAGDDVQLSVTFANTGSISLDGSVIVAVFDALGDLEIEFRDEFAGLSPGSSIPFGFLWSPATLAPTDCRVVAYAQFAGRTTALSVAPGWVAPPLCWDWMAVSPAGIHLRWPSVMGRRYRIEHTPNLSTIAFSAIATNLPATPPCNEATLPILDPQGFYRLAEE